MTSKANLYLGTGILALLLFVDVGCKSKFAESAPETVQQQGLSLKERVQQKQQVDSRITEIEEALKKIKNIVELIRKANDTAFDTYYTAFDLLLDVNTELKTKFPENIEGKKVRYGTLIIPSDIVTSDCKNIATSLVSDDGLDSTGAFVGETLTYGFKSCGSDKYLDTVQAHWINQELEIKLISQNLETVFNSIHLADPPPNSQCKILRDENKAIQQISCQNVNIRISVFKSVSIKDLTYYSTGDTRLEAVANIFEDNKLKATATIKVLSTGETKFELKKVDLP